jgi:hypothetical protein
VGVRKAALIDLAPDKGECLAAILRRLETEVVAWDWETCFASAPDLVVCPIDSIVHELATSTETWNSLQSILLTGAAGPDSATLDLQIRYGLFNFLPDELWRDPACIERILHCLLFPQEIFNLRLFLPHAASMRRLRVSTLAEKHHVAEEIVELIRPHTTNPRYTRDVHLIVNELINNAFFHSFRDDQGDQKYSPRRFTKLDDQDQVLIHVAVGPEGIALAVEDNRGSLAPAQVLRYMLRQTSGEGVYDSHGRGFYLISQLTHHLAVCIDPGHRTRIVSLSHFDDGKAVHTLEFFITNAARPLE